MADPGEGHRDIWPLQKFLFCIKPQITIDLFARICIWLCFESLFVDQFHRVRSLGNEIDGGGSRSSPPPPGFPNCLEFSQAAPMECPGVARPQAERPPVKPKARQRPPDSVACREPSRTDDDGGPLSVRLREAFGNGSGFRKCERFGEDVFCNFVSHS